MLGVFVEVVHRALRSDALVWVLGFRVTHACSGPGCWNQEQAAGCMRAFSVQHLGHATPPLRHSVVARCKEGPVMGLSLQHGRSAAASRSVPHNGKAVLGGQAQESPASG